MTHTSNFAMKLSLKAAEELLNLAKEVMAHKTSFATSITRFNENSLIKEIDRLGARYETVTQIMIKSQAREAIAESIPIVQVEKFIYGLTIASEVALKMMQLVEDILPEQHEDFPSWRQRCTVM